MLGYSTVGVKTVSGDPGWAPGAGAGFSDAHPVGSSTATSPAAAAATVKVFLLFAFIGGAFLCE
ncbi:MAG: hypothetical protein ACXVYI_13740 [Mycobacterium sp.]